MSALKLKIKLKDKKPYDIIFGILEDTANNPEDFWSCFGPPRFFVKRGRPWEPAWDAAWREAAKKNSIPSWYVSQAGTDDEMERAIIAMGPHYPRVQPLMLSDGSHQTCTEKLAHLQTVRAAEGRQFTLSMIVRGSRLPADVERVVKELSKPMQSRWWHHPTDTSDFDLVFTLKAVVANLGVQAVWWLNAAPLCFRGLWPPDMCFRNGEANLWNKLQLVAVREYIAIGIGTERPDFVAPFPESPGWLFISQMAPRAALLTGYVDAEVCQKAFETLCDLLSSIRQPVAMFWHYSRGCLVVRECPFGASLQLALPQGLTLSPEAIELFKYVEQQPFSYHVTVKVPMDDDVFTLRWRGKEASVRILSALDMCNAFLVQGTRDDGEIIICPREHIVEEKALPPETNVNAQYQLSAHTKGYENEWVDASVLKEVNGGVVLHLPEFRGDDWWSAFSFISKESDRFRERGEPDPKKSKK